MTFDHPKQSDPTESDPKRSTSAQSDPASHRPPPLQFGLRSLLGITLAVALLFGTLRWLEVPARASAMVLLILIAGVAAALGLVLAIAGATNDDS